MDIKNDLIVPFKCFPSSFKVEKQATKNQQKQIFDK